MDSEAPAPDAAVDVRAQNLAGSAFNDVLTGSAGANRIDGASGDDVIEGGQGADVLMGGTGNDTASYAGASSAVTVAARSGEQWTWPDGAHQSPLGSSSGKSPAVR